MRLETAFSSLCRSRPIREEDRKRCLEVDRKRCLHLLVKAWCLSRTWCAILLGVFRTVLCVFVCLPPCQKALRAQRHRDNENAADFGNWLFSRVQAGPVDLAVSSAFFALALDVFTFQGGGAIANFWRRDWLGGWRLWGKGSRGLLPFLSRDLPMPILLIQVTFCSCLLGFFL